MLIDDESAPTIEDLDEILLELKGAGKDKRKLTVSEIAEEMIGFVEYMKTLLIKTEKLQRHIDQMSCCCSGCTKHNALIERPKDDYFKEGQDERDI